MPRSLLLAAAAAMAAAAVPAQCINTAGGTSVVLVPTTTFWPAHDEGLSAPLPLGFAFPLGGSTFTHVAIESNGVAYLTNGSAPVGTTLYGFADMSGMPGDSPRIAGFWGDLEGPAAGYDVRIDTSVSGQCKISWIDVYEFTWTTPFTFQVVLHSSGLVECSAPVAYAIQNWQATVGVSAGNGLAGTSSDLSAGASSATAILYEDFFAGPMDIGNTTVTLVPGGTGGFTALTTCTGPVPASHTDYGAGCYTLAASFYELFPSPGFDLSGTSMSMLPSGTGYTVLPGLTSYVAPSAAATPLTLFDDDETTVALLSPFPYPGGVTSSLVVCSNGFVSPALGNGTNYWPDVPSFLGDPEVSWRTWHDFNPAAPGSGQVKFEQIGAVAYVTWDGVYSYGTTTPETFQLQFDTATGAVHMVWVTLSGAGNEYLVGYSPAGVSIDPGSIDLSAALPATFAVAGADLLPLTLSAAPRPVSGATSGTVVTYTTDHLPAFAPGLYVGLNILSLGQVPAPGLDLTFLGAPGCVALVQSLDYTQTMVGPSPSQTVTLTLPAGLPIGTQIFAQSVGLFPPFSLPNNQNAFGVVTSNGVASLISVH